MKRLFLLFILLSFGYNIKSQPFTFIDTKFEEVMQAAGDWVDYNLDGWPDAFITGDKYSGNFQIVSSELHKNLKSEKFLLLRSGIKDVYLAGLAWGDYDNDGDDDLALNGESKNGELFSGIYRNNRGGTFTLTNRDLTPVRDGSMDWGDYDRDGDLDLLMTGENSNHQAVAEIYRNNGNHQFVRINAKLDPVFNGTAKWGDFDNDKLPDILLIGQGSSNETIGKLYHNQGKGNFVQARSSIIPMSMADAAWGDLDNDKDLDIVMSGETQRGEIITVVYRNDGKGSFTEMNTGMQGARAGNLDLGDYDGDGDLDVVITGESDGGSITNVYKNHGGFVFEDVNAGIPGVSLGGAYWGDYDRDGDQDILLLGLDNCYDFSSKIFRNDGVYEKAKIAKNDDERSIFTTRPLNINRVPYYYFIYGSCWCDPFNDETGKKFNAFVSNVHRAPRKYELVERFNSIIMKNVGTWPKVDAGHRISIGYLTKAEAEEGHARVIREYESEGFIIHFVEW
jgi:FG-GAP-like repeat